MSPAHGGDVHAAARELGVPVSRIADFSASINPLGPPRRVLRAVMQNLRSVAHYPDTECAELRDALATHHGVSCDGLLIGNGSTECIYLLPGALRLSKVLVIGPTFSEYARSMALHGVEVKTLNAARRDGYRPPLDRIMEVLDDPQHQVDGVVICNPNSPTGQAIDRERMMTLLEALGRKRCWTVVDETFVDFCEEHSVMPCLERYPRAVVLRSFTKFCAIPGLRIGYLAGNPRVVDRLRAVQPPWSVNGPAQAAARACLGDEWYAARSRRFIEAHRSSLVRQLSRLTGVRVYPSVANFLLLELPVSFTARAVTQRLRRRGVLIRDCSSIRGLTARTVRVAVRSTIENQRLVRTLRQVLSPS